MAAFQVKYEAGEAISPFAEIGLGSNNFIIITDMPLVAVRATYAGIDPDSQVRVIDTPLLSVGPGKPPIIDWLLDDWFDYDAD